MPAPITAEYGFFLLSKNGKQASKAQEYKGLKDCIAAIASAYGLEAGSAYFKAYRAVRQCGMYCVPVFCTILGQEPATNWRMLFVYQVGYQETTPGLVPVEVLGGGPLERLPLERLIEEIKHEQSAPAQAETWRMYTAYYSKRNHITGQPNQKEYIWPVDARSEQEATILATEELRSNAKHQVFIRRVVVGQ